jgi:hypothetical protein
MARPKPATPAFLTYGDLYDGEWALVCPACRFGYAHLREVGALRGSDEFEGTPPDGVRVVGRAVGERRAAVELVYDGECGHAWAIRFQQHKGIELVQVRLVSRLDDDDDGV